MKKLLLLVVFAFTAPLLVVGCGSSGGDEKGSSTTTKTDDAKGDGGDNTTTTGDDKTDETKPDDGGDDPVELSGDAKDYADALTANMIENGGDDLPLTEEQAGCLSPRWVDLIGVEKFKAAGVTPEDIRNDSDGADFEEFKFTEDEANEMVNAFGKCNIDLKEMIEKSMALEEMPAAARECMEKVLTPEALRKIMVLGLTGQDDALDDPNNMPPELAGLMGCAFMGMGEDTTSTPN